MAGRVRFSLRWQGLELRRVCPDLMSNSKSRTRKLCSTIDERSREPQFLVQQVHACLSEDFLDQHHAASLDARSILSDSDTRGARSESREGLGRFQRIFQRTVPRSTAWLTPTSQADKIRPVCIVVSS